MDLKYMKRVLDTNVLIRFPEIVLDGDCIIPSTVFSELESIKSSGKKSEEVRYQARMATRILEENSDSYEIFVVDNSIYDIVSVDFKLPITPDNLIIGSAFKISRDIEEVTFITNDLLARQMGRVFGLIVEGYNSETNVEEYKGFKVEILSDNDMAKLYENTAENTYDCLINEYLVIEDFEGVQKDVLKWNGEHYVPIFNKSIKTMSFGDKIKAKDIYQQMAIDSLFSNTISALSGHAGSGKSLLSLVVAMNLIESGKYDRLVILFNPSKAKGAEDMGFYSGSALDKAMQNSIGQILTTKFGDRFAVDVMLQQGKIKLVSMADARGMEINDNEILYITECQNTSAELLKLCLTRVSQGAKVIIEGDYDTQVDSYAFEGNKNGMKRAIEILKGEDIFGFVELQNVWRSKIASLVDKM